MKHRKGVSDGSVNKNTSLAAKLNGTGKKNVKKSKVKDAAAASTVKKNKSITQPLKLNGTGKKNVKKSKEKVKDAAAASTDDVTDTVEFDTADDDEPVQFEDGFAFELNEDIGNPLVKLASDSQKSELGLIPFQKIGTMKTSVDELIMRYKSRVRTVEDSEEVAMETDEAQTLPITMNDSDKVKVKAKKTKTKVKNLKEGFSQVISSSDPHLSFLKMNLSRPLLRSLSELKWNRPTPIQSACIPVALTGKDICACAKTGSGKTGAFMLPILERLIYKPSGPPVTRVLVLSPTRELSAQIYTVTEQLARHCYPAITINLSTGGLDLKAQEASLRLGPDIVIATPGRLIDHVHNTPNFHLKNIEILVLDEADKLIDEYFIEQIKEIVKLCSTTRQVLLFSATMTDDVTELAAMALKEPVKLFMDSQADVTLKLQQEFVRIRAQREDDREAIVASLVMRAFSDRTIVFCPTKTSCHRLHILLGLMNVNCGELHSNMSQTQRLEALHNFHGGDISVLLATDLVSRGLDIEGVRTVINLSLPSTLKVYIHRVGRTARAGKQGLAISLVGENERPLLKQIVKNAPIPVKVRVIPSTVVTKYRKKIELLEDAIHEILEEEKVESAQRSAEHALNKAEKKFANPNLVTQERNWFQTNQKREKARDQLGLGKKNKRKRTKQDAS